MAASTDNLPAAEHLCPLCGGPNGCAPARSGSFATPCWCQAQGIDAAARARVPPGQRGKACICRRCGTAMPPAPPAESLARLKSEPGQESACRPRVSR